MSISEPKARVRMADLSLPAADLLARAKFVRCNTRTLGDVRAATAGEDIGSLIVPGELPASGRTENPS